MQEFREISAVTQLILLINFLLPYGLHQPLACLPYAAGIAAVLLLELILTTAAYWFGGMRADSIDMGAISRDWIFGLSVTSSMLGYFNLRSSALSPTFSETHFQALQARIHPHLPWRIQLRSATLVRKFGGKSRQYWSLLNNQMDFQISLRLC